jgi:hypothetical protein
MCRSADDENMQMEEICGFVPHLRDADDRMLLSGLNISKPAKIGISKVD